jgi:hypothetical protein
VAGLKAHRVLAVIGYVLIVIGIGAAVYQGFVADDSGTESTTIPAGTGYYVAFKTKSSMWMNAHIDGSITVQGEGTIDAYVLNSAEFDEYAYDLQPTSSLWSSHGTGESFSVDLTQMDQYYIVADHGAGYASTEQTVTLTYTISGINLLYVIFGAGLIAVGAVLSYAAFRMKKKDKIPSQVPVTSSASEVKMFDSKEKLQ